MSNKTKLSYQQIADKSGISIATISRVFNKSQSVSEEKRSQVISAIAELGVDPLTLDLTPRAKDNLIIFNVPTLKNPFYSPIISSARRAAKNFGYNLLVNEDPISDESLPSFLALLKTTKAGGVVCANAIDPDRIMKINEMLPVVTCCEANPALPIPFVSIDDEAASERAVKYLLSMGCQRIAMINGPSDFKYAKDRYKGYKNALASKGIDVNTDYLCSVAADMDYAVAKAHASRMLQLPDRPNAFFCISDVLACAAVKACLEAGLRVPQDVAVVGFDDIQISQIMNPTISTVSQPTAQIGSVAIELLMRLIGRDQGIVKSIYLGAELIIRESSATFM